LQAGYPTGYLLATLVYRFAFPSVGWRGMFMLGALPALLVLYIRRNVPESPSFVAGTTRIGDQAVSIIAVFKKRWPIFLYAIVMMTAFNFFSHGTQDLYPRFLETDHEFDRATRTNIAIFYNIGAILGGITLGTISQRIGRRKAIAIAALLALPAVPVWAGFGSADPYILAVGAFVLQFMVQGAWGVIPAHLNELSPSEIRGTFPGFTYQLGNLIASSNATLQAWLAASFFDKHYAYPLAIVVSIVAVVIAVFVGLGKEAYNVDMNKRTSLAD
jgi:SHS family lactate transporter-like MFS transporter